MGVLEPISALGALLVTVGQQGVADPGRRLQSGHACRTALLLVHSCDTSSETVLVIGV